MTKKVIKKKVVAKKAPVKRKPVVKAKTRATKAIAKPEPVASESVVALPIVLVKCRFCDTMIPKPDNSTVYECDEHKNLTGDPKFNSLGQRTMV
jgi:hypothetical protein